MVDCKDLEYFRQQWKKELKYEIHKSEDDIPPANASSGSQSSGLNKHNPSEENVTSSGLEGDGQARCVSNKYLLPGKEQKQSFDSADKAIIKAKRSSSNDDKQLSEGDNRFKPFLIAERLLEGVSGEESVQTEDKSEEERLRELFIQSRNKRLKLSSADAVHDHNKDGTSSFLDIFLADLNDINEIPFFETSLPRELAIKIFMHLEPLDLCRCSQVSKAWKNLAEDELLWNQICCRLGYEDSTATVEKSKWKEIVKEHVLKERQLRQNWKMRHGEMSSLEYVTGGILCAASSSNHRLVAGYSNGHVRVWDENDDYTFSPSNTALVINESAECGTVSNMVSRVCVNSELVAASYSQGNVDIWQVDSKITSPVSTLALNKHIAGLSCSRVEPLVVFHAGDTVWTYDCQQSQNNTSFEEIPAGSPVLHMSIVPKKKQFRSGHLLALGFYDQVKVHCLGDDPNAMTIIHNTVGHKVTYTECSYDQIAIGIHSEEGCIVKLYDLYKLAELNTLIGSTLPISVVNLADSPPNSLVTGSADAKVRVYDTRLADPVIILRGHAGLIKCVQMDDWKVVSGGSDGMIIVWDQRMANKLWEQHNRHPVEYLAFKDNIMYTANIPGDKMPESDGFDSIYHRRYRGSLCSYNFSVDLIRHPDLPANVLSTYDDPEGYNYNINLAVPYD